MGKHGAVEFFPQINRVLIGFPHIFTNRNFKHMVTFFFSSSFVTTIIVIGYIYSLVIMMTVIIMKNDNGCQLNLS